MGANMVRRLHAGRPRLRRLRRRPTRRSTRSTARASPARRTLDEFVAALDRAAARVDDGAGRVRRRHDRRAGARCSSPATRSSTAATRSTATTSTAPAARAERGIHYLDVGTSGGVFGLERGYCLMIGGDDDAVDRLAPIFDTLAPGVDAAERTPGPRAATRRTAERGWLHCGPSGAGHFVKMVHNGIEYGLMAAYAEGLNVLAKANIGARGPPDGRRDRAARRPAVLPVRPRPRRGHRGVAARQRRCRQLAARPHRRRARRRPAARRSSPARQRLRRGPLDDARRDRRGRAGARCCRPRCSSASARAAGPTSPTRSSRRCAPVRRPRRERTDSPHDEPPRRRARPRNQPAADALVLFGATGDLAKRKLFPALYRPGAARQARRSRSSASPAATGPTTTFREHAREAIIAARSPDADEAVIDALCERLDLIQGDYADHDDVERRCADTLDKHDSRDRRVLHGDPADDVPDGRRVAGVGRPQRARPDRRREAVRARPRSRRTS